MRFILMNLGFHFLIPLSLGAAKRALSRDGSGENLLLKTINSCSLAIVFRAFGGKTRHRNGERGVYSLAPPYTPAGQPSAGSL
jgi:hypothetical protein